MAHSEDKNMFKMAVCAQDKIVHRVKILIGVMGTHWGKVYSDNPSTTVIRYGQQAALFRRSFFGKTEYL